jgi:hypothetical protein
MKKTILTTALLILSCIVFGQTQTSQGIKLKFPGLTQENKITKSDLLNTKRLETVNKNVSIVSFKITTVDKKGYIHDYTFDKNEFNQEARNWLKEKIIPGHKITIEDIKATKKNKRIHIEPQVIKVIGD